MLTFPSTKKICPNLPTSCMALHWREESELTLLWFMLITFLTASNQSLIPVLLPSGRSSRYMRLVDARWVLNMGLAGKIFESHAHSPSHSHLDVDITSSTTAQVRAADESTSTGENGENLPVNTIYLDAHTEDEIIISIDQIVNAKHPLQDI